MESGPHIPTQVLWEDPPPGRVSSESMKSHWSTQALTLEDKGLTHLLLSVLFFLRK